MCFPEWGRRHGHCVCSALGQRGPWWSPCPRRPHLLRDVRRGRQRDVMRGLAEGRTACQSHRGDTEAFMKAVAFEGTLGGWPNVPAEQRGAPPRVLLVGPLQPLSLHRLLPPRLPLLGLPAGWHLTVVTSGRHQRQVAGWEEERSAYLFLCFLSMRLHAAGGHSPLPEAPRCTLVLGATSLPTQA